MSLAAMLRQRTAEVATRTTQDGRKGVGVAEVAEVAVANQKAAEDAPDPGAHFRWRVTFANRPPLEVTYSPMATNAEAMSEYPDALTAETLEPIRETPAAGLTASDEATIRALMVTFGETDPEVIGEVMRQCQTDASARRFYLRLADDDRP